MRLFFFAVPMLFTLVAHAGPYDDARGRAIKALKAATKQIDSVSSCAQTQGANIRDAQRQVNALKRGAASDTYEGINLFLGGLALGGALSSCPNALYGHLTTAQNAITDMQNAAAVRAAAVAPVAYDDDDDTEDAEQGITVDAIDVDTDFIDQTRSPAILFHARGVSASGLDGAKVKWSLLVKRKNAKWTKAHAYSIGDARVQRGGALGDVSISVRYASFERDGFTSGAHVAALVGKMGKAEVVREEVPFTIASVEANDDVVTARGPSAMSQQAFGGFLAALNGTSTDFSKADMIKKAAAKNHFTAQQLGQMLDTLSTDFSKVDASKAVVPKLVDAENAYGLAEKFSTSFSKQEFTALL
jgi:hypothetical protein